MSLEEEEGSVEVEEEEELPEDGLTSPEGFTGEVEAAVESTVGNYNAKSVNEKIFEELAVGTDLSFEVQHAWKAFLNTAESREAAGEAIYAALFDAAPSLQSLFKTPRAIMAMRFMNGVTSIIGSLHDPKGLKIIVETLGFQHLDLEVTVPRVVIFRDAIVELIQAEMGAKLTPRVRDAFAVVLNYVGGSYIYVRKEFSGRLKLLLSSWAAATRSKDNEVVDGEEGDENVPKEGEGAQASASGEVELIKSSPDKGTANGKNVIEKNENIQNTSVPKTFKDMFMFNSAVMGFSSSTWMYEILNAFDAIVRNVANSFRLQEECDVLSLRIAKCKTTNMNLSNYKAVMLASLRSLVKDWGSQHEVSWSWLWENVERMLKTLLGKPAVQEKALTQLVGSLDEAARQKIRRDCYAKFFVIAPAGQDYFKQSTTRLHFIVDKLVQMTQDMYKDPTRMVEEISALGLRHVGFGIPTDLFGPFVTACVQVVRTLTNDDVAEDAFRWSLNLISRILQRVINEGSTIVMKAINLNNAKQMKKAIGLAPRGQRASWMLNIQVGTQSISPLYWSLESGALEAAGAIIEDLLTIRADRDRYYYAADDLFIRHPDVIQRLCTDGRSLLPTLLDGLIWRARVADGGRRRVNFFIKHLLVDSGGHLNEAMTWIQELGDPKIVCHEVLVRLSDLVWNGPVFNAFLSTKAWVLFTFVLYLIAQSILSQFGLDEETTALGDATRTAQLALRLSVYAFCMGQLLLYHSRCSFKSWRAGETTKILRCVPIPTYLCNFQEFISLVQCFVLIWMLATEPKFYCMGHWEGTFVGNGKFTDHCAAADHVRPAYGVFSACVMLIFFLRILDLAVLNNTLSAYVITAGRVLQQVFLFLIALAFVTFAYACSVTTLMESEIEFEGIPKASLSFFMVAFHMFDPSNFELIKSEGLVWIFLLISLFIACIDIFLVNLLIAQICSEHHAVYDDMVGYARMRRVSCIYYTMPYVSKKRWERWVSSLGFESRLEFNQGDVGLSGGIQVTEPSNLNPTLIDAITRFGGTTSRASPWPALGDDEDKEKQGFDRLEKMMARIGKRIDEVKTGKGGAGSSLDGTGSGLGSKDGSGHQSSGDE